MLIGSCIDRFLTVQIRAVLDLQDRLPLGIYILSIIAIYACALLLCNFVSKKFFEHDVYPNDKESKGLIFFYIISFIFLIDLYYASWSIIDYSFPQILEITQDNVYTDTILAYAKIVLSVIPLIIFAFQFLVYYMTRLQQERTTLSLLTAQQTKQYERTAQTMDYINQISHDLKHRIAALRVEESEDSLGIATSDSKSAFLNDIDTAIAQYDSTIHTGNKAIDILLTEKNWMCQQRNIRFSCVMDHMDLSRIELSDLYTMVGNALDNAIEHVNSFDSSVDSSLNNGAQSKSEIDSKIDSEVDSGIDDMRTISLVGRLRGNIVTLTVENYLSANALNLAKDGQYGGDSSVAGTDLPNTTKQNRIAHGLGLKSIRRIARSYGGDIHVNTDNGIFSLQISFTI